MQKFLLADNPQPRFVPAYPYLLGVYLGDGCVTMSKRNGNYVFRLNVIDEDFIQHTALALKEVTGKKPMIYPRPDQGFGKQPRIELALYSKELCEQLKKETEKETLPLSLSKWNRDEKLAFIAGIMDSEGYVSVAKRSDRPNNQIQVGITVCGQWIDSFAKLLQSLQIEIGKRQEYQTKFGTTAVRYMIKTSSFISSGAYFTIKRKKNRLRDYMRYSQGYIDSLGRRYSPILLETVS